MASKPETIASIKSLADFEDALRTSPSVVVHFWAPWCEPCKYMDAVLEELAKLHPLVKFVKVEAEEISDVTERYDVSAVPCFVLIKGGIEFDRLEGADAASLTSKVEALSQSGGSAARTQHQVQPPQPPKLSQPPPVVDVNERIRLLLQRHPVLLFMKGSPEAPQCGFSSHVVQDLRDCGASFQHFDILSDDAIRQGLKTYSNWPTYPQLYVNGELIGGCDIIREMKASSELQEVLKTVAVPGDENEILTSRLKQLIQQAPVMLFMKGSPDAPRCKFSRQVVDMLQEAGCSYGHFDILSDQEVREGLKKLSDWPTYPQLYVGGELMGGCDIIREMKDSGELQELVRQHKSSNAPSVSTASTATLQDPLIIH